MSKLQDALLDGSSYLTASSEDIEADGQALYDAILEIANILSGENYDDADDHDDDLIDHIIGFVGYPGLETMPFDPQEAAVYIDQSAKSTGGAGWL